MTAPPRNDRFPGGFPYLDIISVSGVIAVVAREILAAPESKAHQTVKQRQKTQSNNHQTKVEHELYGRAESPDADNYAGNEDYEPQNHVGLSLSVYYFLISGLDLGRSLLSVFHNQLEFLCSGFIFLWKHLSNINNPLIKNAHHRQAFED